VDPTGEAAIRIRGLPRRPARAQGPWSWIAALTLLACTIALCSNRVHNGDVYVQLASGRFVTEHGLVWHDPFPTIAANQPWHNQQWLAEILFYNVTRLVGLTGLTIVYALLLGAPLFCLLSYCRRKGRWMLLAGATLYVPVLYAILHPRAAGFTLLAFSLLGILAIKGSEARSPTQPGRRLRRSLVAIPALFVVWANLHGGFIAGLLLIALVAAGLAIDRLRGLPGSPRWRDIGALAMAGVLGFAATFVTPLGPGIWSYALSFRNPSLRLATSEWASALDSTLPTVYLVIAAGFAAWLWHRAPRPRSAMPLLVTCGFLLASTYSLRNLILVAPAILFQIARSAPDRDEPASRGALLIAGSATVAAALTWSLLLGPAHRPPVSSQIVAYAIAHPPPSGRIATIAGTGSYLLWRSPNTPVLIDGWLEHFSATQLRGAYGVVDGNPAAIPYIERWHIGAIITRHLRALRTLEAQGFVPLYTNSHGAYLVRRTAH